MTFRPFSLSVLTLLSVGVLVACGSKPPAAPPLEKPAAPPGPPPVVHSNTALEKCDKPLGSLMVNEDIGSIWYSQLRGYKLPSASAALRVLVQQSGCFVWIDASSGGTSTNKTKSGKSTPPPKPDFTLSPSISFTDAAANAPGKSTIEAATTLTLQDNRSTVQLAETEGSARYVEFSTFSPLFSAPSAGASAFVKSPEGQVIAASFVDAYNLLVRAARKYQLPDVKTNLPDTPKVPNVSRPDLPTKPSVQAPTVQTPSIKTPDASSLKIKP